jgi:hypothetical protein
MRRPSATLTDAELEIMHVVWKLRRATVRDVYETLRERRKVAYTRRNAWWIARMFTRRRVPGAKSSA